MTTWSALTTLPSKDAAQGLADALETLAPEPTGIGVFEIEDGSGLWEVGGFYIDKPDPIQLDLLAAVHGGRPFALSKVPDKDWVAEVRRELAPIEAGRFFLYGSHDANKVPNGRVPLLIEAAMAFGTGHHGTTKGCLLEFERLLQNGWQGRSVLDLGCGTAVLALAAAKTLDAEILASDIDPVATETALANARVNDVTERISVVTAAGFDHPDLKRTAPYDLIFANILKGPLIDLAPDMAEGVAHSGRVILSGILVEQSIETQKAYENQGFELEHSTSIGGWVALTVRKAA